MGLLWWTPAFLAHASSDHGQAGTLVGTVSGIAGARYHCGGLLIHSCRAATRAGKCGWSAPRRCSHPGIGRRVRDRQLAVGTLALWIFVPVAYLNLGPILSLTQSLVRPRMRGLTCALLLFGANVANLALAPQFIGILSDQLAQHFAAGSGSLRWALLINSLTACGGVSFLGGGTLHPHDLQRTEAESR